MRDIVNYLVLIVLAGLLLLAACAHSAAGSAPIPLPPEQPKDLAAWFAGFYEPVPVTVKPAVPAYTLPLKPGEISNLDKIMGALGLGEEPRKLLLGSGIAALPFGSHDDVAAAYERIQEMDLPVFVTTDSILHLYHIQFDETLRAIEEKEFYPDMIALSRALQEEFNRRLSGSKGIEREAMKKGLAYMTVGLKLLDPKAAVPGEVRDLVGPELKLIEAHEGFADSPIFTYREDYSQYVPRGHYTRSDSLKRYFKAMMWYGRLTMLIKGHPDFGPEAQQPALVPVAEAQAQTAMAATIAAGLPQLKLKDGRTGAAVWERLYAVTAYYVGLADDLTPGDYRGALRNAFGPNFNPAAIADEANFRKLQNEIVRLPKPAIYSGTGESAVNLDLEPGRALNPEQLDRILFKTMGLRLLGQRYVPDSFILGQMVAPVVGNLTGAPCFTTVIIPDFGPVRAFPRGLDVMAVLGSDRALAILQKLGDANYQKYDEQLAKLRQQFGEIGVQDWNRNLYWSWLYALKGLMAPVSGPGWPTFMTTAAWQDKELNAALGSWSSLRHDTILYAKQSYTPTLKAESVAPPVIARPVVGYVEPAPEFYARLVALTRMTRKGLSEMKALDPEALGRLQALEDLIARLQSLSERELRNETLDQADYDFIKNFADNLTAVVAGAEATAQKTTLIADVHTDQNSKEVLEEGTGYLRLLLVAYKLPQGHILVGAGPTYSYYEFRHPMADRLTDEKWRELLAGSPAPKLPEWTSSFAAP
jgi:hypothetical protein